MCMSQMTYPALHPTTLLVVVQTGLGDLSSERGCLSLSVAWDSGLKPNTSWAFKVSHLLFICTLLLLPSLVYCFKLRTAECCWTEVVDYLGKEREGRGGAWERNIPPCLWHIRRRSRCEWFYLSGIINTQRQKGGAAEHGRRIWAVTIRSVVSNHASQRAEGIAAPALLTN